MLEPLMVIPRSQTYDLGNGKLGVYWPPKPGETATSLEILPGGQFQMVGHPGAYGEFTLVDDALYVTPVDPATGIGYTYAFRCPKL